MNLNRKLSEIAEVEFSDVVEFAEDLEEKLRIYIRDGSYIDVWFSRKIEARYTYHWERRHLDGTVYRHDNIPHEKWKYTETFPKHFHNGSEHGVCDSSISDEPVEAIREFLSFVQQLIDEQSEMKITTNHPCTKCEHPATIFQPYSGMHLCKQHLIDDVTRKTKRDLRKYNLPPGTIAVALSGGKDSSALLHLLHNILAPNRKIKIVAITVDEGISGYREKTIENASSLTGDLGVEHTIVSFEESFGRTLDDLLETTNHPPCSVCGALRKNLLNRTAKELGASYLAIGHNLDDEAQTILINHLRGDIGRLARLSHARVQPGLVPRIKPLRHVPESEITAYAGAVGLPVCPKACPYMDEAYRLGVRVFLREFEDVHPGTRHGIVRGFDRMISALGDSYPPASLVPCRVCGEPCTDGLCQACKLLGRA